MPEESIDPRVVEQTRQQIRRLVEEISELSNSDIPPQRFYPEFLRRVIDSVAAVGGALWIRDGQGQPRLQFELDFGQSGLLEQAAQSNGHGSLLENTFRDGNPKLLPPQASAGIEEDAGTNVSDWSLILSPLKVNSETVGLVELILDPGRREQAQKNAVRFVSELCEMGADYIRNNQIRQMSTQQQVWSQLEEFTKQIHTSLDSREVSYIIANEGKRLAGCDRLSVAIRYGRRAVVEGVSGQEVVEKRGNLVRTMTRLTNAVIQADEDLHYAGEEFDSLTPAVQDALEDYLVESDSKILVITLLRPPEKDGKQQEPFGAIIAEELEEVTSPEDLANRVAVIAQHATVSVSNALTYKRIFMLPVWRAVGNATKWMRGNRLAKVSAAVAVIAAVTAAMFLVQLELRLEGKGELLPADRTFHYAKEASQVTQVHVEHGQLVGEGDLLLTLRSEELETQLLDVQNRLAESRAMRDGSLTRSDSDRGMQLRIARQNIESLSKQIDMYEKRLANLHVKAKSSGMIADYDPKLNLGGKPVNVGDPLLRVLGLRDYKKSDANAADDGNPSGLILEVKMPEDVMGHILEHEKKVGNENLTAQFILVSYPNRKFEGEVIEIASTAELDQEVREHTVMVKIAPKGIQSVTVDRSPIEGSDGEEVRTIVLKFEGDDNPYYISPGAEVRAKIECGKFPMGYVLLRELIEFFYETVLF